MVNKRDGYVILGWDIDTASQKKAIDNIKALKAEYERLDKSTRQSVEQTRAHFERSERAAEAYQKEAKQSATITQTLVSELGKLGRQRAIDEIAADLRQAVKEGADLNAVLQQAETRLRALGGTPTNVEIASLARGLVPRGASGGGSVPSRNFERPAMIASQVLSGLGQSELANVAGLVGDVADGLDSLGKNASLFIGVVGGAGFVLSAWIAQANRVSEALRHEIQVRRQVEQAIRDMTTAEAQRAITEQQQRQRDAEEELKSLEQQRQEALGAGDVIQSLFSGLALSTNVGIIKGYTEEIAEQQGIVADAKLQIEQFNLLLSQNATAINDAREAMAAGFEGFNSGLASNLDNIQKQIDARNQADIASAEAARQQLIEVERLKAGTAEQARERQAALALENSGLIASRDALLASGNTHKVVTAQIEAYNKQIQANAEVMALIGREIIPFLAGLEAQAAALQSVVDASNAERVAYEQLVERQREYSAELARHESVLANIAATEAAAVARAEASRVAAIVAAEGQAQEALEKAAEKARNDRVASEVRHLEALARIRQTFAKSARQAASQLNASALQDAIEQRDEDRRNENREYKKRQSEINRTLEDTRRDIERNLDQQRTAINARYQQQVSDAAAAANAALEIENAKFNNEIAIRGQALDIALAQYRAFLETLQQMAANTGRNIVVPETTTLTYDQLIAQGFLQPSAAVPQYQHGTPDTGPRRHLAMVHPHERVLTAAENRAYTAAMNMRGTGSAAQRQQPAVNVGDIVNSFNGDMTEAQFEAAMIRALRKAAG